MIILKCSNFVMSFATNKSYKFVYKFASFDYITKYINKKITLKQMTARYIYEDIFLF